MQDVDILHTSDLVVGFVFLNGQGNACTITRAPYGSTKTVDCRSETGNEFECNANYLLRKLYKSEYLIPVKVLGHIDPYAMQACDDNGQPQGPASMNRLLIV